MEEFNQGCSNSLFLRIVQNFDTEFFSMLACFILSLGVGRPNLAPYNVPGFNSTHMPSQVSINLLISIFYLHKTHLRVSVIETLQGLLGGTR